jgi:hypothetical protein
MVRAEQHLHLVSRYDYLYSPKYSENNSSSDGKKGAVFTFSIPLGKVGHEQKQSEGRRKDEQQ